MRDTKCSLLRQPLVTVVVCLLLVDKASSQRMCTARGLLNESSVVLHFNETSCASLLFEVAA